VLRETTHRQALIIAVDLGHNPDQDRNASAIDIVVLAKVQQDIARAFA